MHLYFQGTSSFHQLLLPCQKKKLQTYGLRNFAKVIADEKIRRQNYQSDSFTRTGLLHMFAQGKDSISLDFPVDHADGSRHWRQGTVSIIKNPDTGDVEAVDLCCRYRQTA
jgi:hypothetical protein